MIFSMIVAAAENDVIGRDGALPWRIRADSRRFRALTIGHVVVLGRVTHDSIVAKLGRPLPGRTSVVISRGSPPGGAGAASVPHAAGVPAAGSVPAAGGGADAGRVIWADSVESGLEIARRHAAAAGDPEVFIAGGVSVYSGALPVTGRIYLTRVHRSVAGDRAMPPGWLAGFGLVRREDGTDADSQLSYSFLDYERAAR